MERTYRVTVKGRFSDLDDEQKQELRAGIETLPFGFTEDGAFQYDRDLYAFTFRYVIRVENYNPADSDVEAAMVAGEQAGA